MKLPKRWHAAAGPLGLMWLIGVAGCSPLSMATSAISEMRGAHGQWHAVQSMSAGALAGVQAVTFEPAMTTVGSQLAPSNLLRSYDQAVGRKFAKAMGEQFPGGAPAISISTEFLFFRAKGLISGGTCLARVRGRSDAGLLFDGIVHVESKALTQGGESAMGEAAADAVVSYLKGQAKR